MMKTYVTKPSRGNRLSAKAGALITLALTAAFLSSAVAWAQTPVSTAEKVFNVFWGNGVANQKVQVYWPASTQVDGIYEITVTGNFHNTNTNGGIQKRIVINGRHVGLIQMQQSEVPFRLGNTGNSYTISNIMWDSTNSRYYFVVANLDNAMNETTIHVKSITPSPNVPNADRLNVSPIYTTDATVYPQLNRSFMGGNVGIGTESPDALLALRKDQTGPTAIRLENNNAAGFSGLYLNGNPFVQPAGGFLQWNNNTGANNLFLSTAGANPLYLGTNNSARLTVLPNSGNVGIGTMAPAGKLDIAGGADASGAGDQYDIALQYRLGGFRHRITSRHNSAAQAGNAIDFFVWKHGTDATTAIGTQHVMTLDGNGAVGIGNTAPAYKLDVAGSVRSSTGGFVFPDGTVQTTAASGTGGGSGTGPWSAPNAGGHVNNTNTGNVGIGTSSPNQKLGVQGMLGLYPQAWVAPTGRGMFMMHNGSAGAIYAYNYPGAVGDPIHINGSSVALSTYVNGNSVERITAAANGNVGIGTTAPSQKLHVFGGNVFHQFSSTLGQEWGFYTSINNNHLSSNLYFDGQWKMMTPGKGALISTAPLYGSAFNVIADNTDRAASATAAPATLMRVNMDGNVAIGNHAPAHKLDVAGAVRSSSGGFIFPDGTIQTTAASGGGSGTGPWSAPSAGGHINNTNSGNVGIGTSSLNQKLEIGSGGGVGFSSPTINSADKKLYSPSDGVLEWMTNNLASGHGFAVSHQGTKAVFLNTSGNSYFNGGNVGVGTASPLSKLDVHGGRWFGTVDGANLSVSDDSVTAAGVGGSASFVGRYNSAGDYAGFGRILGVKENGTDGNYAGALVFQTRVHGGNQTEYMRITSGGNVGVGVAAPAYKLDVSGEINATGLRINGTPISVGSGGSSQWTTSGSNIFYNTGNIGVGTATPSAKLDVAGPTTGYGPTIRASGGGDVVLASGGSLFFDGNYAYASGNYIRPMGANTQGFFTSGVERLRISSGGNVGIGTSDPAPEAKLQVQGNVSVIGDITATGNLAAKYQDVAEWVPSSQKLPAGTVVVLDTERSNHVLASLKPYDTRVAGVVSAQPGVILGEGGEGKLMVATTGRVRIRVDAARGPVRVGDLLVTSGVEGVAMKSEPLSLGGVAIHRPGTLIGKALEPLEKGVGEILVLLSLQ